MVPYPGSDDAVKMGCICARMDNNYGAGMYTINGEPIFAINLGCPLHGDIPFQNPHSDHDEDPS